MEYPTHLNARHLMFAALVFFAASLFFAFAPKSDAATLYWRGTANTVALDRTRWENKNNWSSHPRGPANVAAAPGASDTAVFNFSGTSVQIRSAVSVGGLVITNVWTGSILQGTGTLTVGTSGIRIGSGHLIGSTAALTTTGGFTQTGGIVRNLQGTMTVSGSLTLGASSSFTQTGGTLAFNADSPQTVTVSTSNQQFYNLTVNNTGTASRSHVTFSGNSYTVLNDVTVTQGALNNEANAVAAYVVGNITVANSALARFFTDANLTFSGNIIVKPLATFTQSGGTAYPDASSQTLSGSMTFYNLERIANATLLFYPSDTYTYTITNSLNTHGASSTSLLTMKSAVAGSRWRISPTVKETITYVALTDSHNVGVTNERCLDCTNGGNNLLWSFETSPSSSTSTTVSGSSGGGGGGGGGSRIFTNATQATTSQVEKALTKIIADNDKKSPAQKQAEAKIKGLTNRTAVILKKLEKALNDKDKKRFNDTIILIKNVIKRLQERSAK